MNETYFPDDIWGEIKSFLLPPPLPKDPHPLSILIKDLSNIYTIDPPIDKVLYGYCISCHDHTGWYFCGNDKFVPLNVRDYSFVCYKCRKLELRFTGSFF